MGLNYFTVNLCQEVLDQRCVFAAEVPSTRICSLTNLSLAWERVRPAGSITSNLPAEPRVRCKEDECGFQPQNQDQEFDKFHLNKASPTTSSVPFKIEECTGRGRLWATPSRHKTSQDQD